MDRGINFRVAELPNADEFQLHIYAALGQQERKYISLRTKEALAVVKASGKRLGRSKENKLAALDYDKQIMPHMRKYVLEGLKQTRIADLLYDQNLTTFRGKPWTQVKGSNIMRKHQLMAAG